MAPIGTDFLSDYGAPSESVTIALSVPGVLASAADNVGEFINVLESVSIALAVVGGALAVDVADVVGETDAVTVQIPMPVVVAETHAASEAVELAFNPLLVAVSDDVPVADAVVLAFVADVVVVVSDEVPGSEAVTVQVPLAVVVADDTPAAEFVNAASSLGISVFDDHTDPPLEPPPMPATGIARDYVDVEEGLAMGLGIPVVVGDDMTVGEAVAIALPLPVLAVDQLVPVDAIDATFITVQPLFAEVVDVVSPMDVAIMAPTITVSVVDTVAAAEAVQASLPMAPVADDTGTPAEAVDVRTGALLVDVRDDETPTDVVVGEVSVLLLGVMDLLTLEDVAGSLIPMAIRVVDEPVGAEDFAIGERRRVTSGLLDDLHLINDGSRESVLTGGAVTRRI